MAADESLRFICDGTVGRLTRWLRLLGCDTIYDPSTFIGDLDDQARREGRWVVTRKQRFIPTRLRRTVILTADDPAGQLRQMGDRFPTLPKSPVFTRCPECNHLIEEVSKSQMEGLVPEFTFRTVTSFSRCPSCGRIYWEGTHWERMADFLRTVWPKKRS